MDIAVCRLLLLQLGYDLDLQETKRRYDAIKQKQDHRLLHYCISTNDPRSINRQK